METDIRKIVVLLMLCSIIAVITGRLGLYTRPHVRHAVWIAGPSLLLIGLFSVHPLLRKRLADVIIAMTIVGVATPLLSLLCGRLAFIYEVYKAEGFFERSFPVIEAYHAKYGHYPETFTFQCSDAPMAVRPLCRSGVINDEFVYHATSDGKTDGFVINFWPPPDCACLDKASWIARGYVSMNGKWGWGLVD